MSILDINADVLPFLQLSADDSFGNVARIQAQAEQYFKTYCGRNFEQTAMKEVIRRNNDLSVFLKEYPVISVQKLAVGRQTALTVSNSNSATTAQVAVTATGITLAYNYGTPTTLLFSSYATMAAMAAAVNSAGSGFSAVVTAGYDQTLSSELVLQTSLECINSASGELAVPAQGLSGYQLNELTGEITTDCTGDPVGSHYMTGGVCIEAISVRPSVHVPFLHVRTPALIYAYYTAGYAPGSVPDDLKLGILALIKSTYDRVNEGTLGVTMYRIEGLQKMMRDALPPETQAVLDIYKRRRF